MVETIDCWSTDSEWSIEKWRRWWRWWWQRRLGRWPRFKHGCIGHTNQRHDSIGRSGKTIGRALRSIRSFDRGTWSSPISVATTTTRLVSFLGKEEGTETEGSRNGERSSCWSWTTRNHGESAVCCWTTSLHRKSSQGHRWIQIIIRQGKSKTTISTPWSLSLSLLSRLVMREEPERTEVSLARPRSGGRRQRKDSGEGFQQERHSEDLNETLRGRYHRRRDFLHVAWQGLETILQQKHGQGDSRDGQRIHSMAAHGRRV